MKFMTRLAVLFYLTIVLLVVVSMLAFVLNLVDFQNVADVLRFTYSDLQMRGVFGGTAIILLLVSLMFSRIIYEEQQRGKTIAFDNPSGRVSVSLTAMEDLVRRMIGRVPEVKEVKASITASRKGMEITAKLILKSEVNIPEMTSKLQEMVKKKIQSTIGLDEKIIVKIHVIKIIPETIKPKRSKDDEITKDDQDASGANIPFQGYRP